MGNKRDLYHKVKFVQGEKFLTVEETQNLSSEELMKFINFLMDDDFKDVEHVTILMDEKFPESVEDYLREFEFQLHDENVFVHCDLNEVTPSESSFLFKSLHEVSEERFKQVWEKSMAGSLNATSSLKMDDQMESVKKELGLTYKESCQIAYQDDAEIGVVMPHIEPGTKHEGRIFYFGLVPEARGKRLSVPLYKQGLSMLKDHFGAIYSVGATSVNNTPMLRVFKQNHCTVTGKVKVYKKSLEGNR